MSISLGVCPCSEEMGAFSVTILAGMLALQAGLFSTGSASLTLDIGTSGS